MNRVPGVLVVAALALALHAQAARAVIAPEAKKILDRYIEATGGRAALLAERSQHLWAGLSALGFSGRIEAWAQVPNKRTSTTMLGPFTLRDGDDGVAAWRVDQNGKLALRDGRDLDEARASTWFENDQWLIDDRGAVSRIGTEKDSSGTYDVLEIAPPVGRSRRLWFDRATGFHARTVVKDDQRTVVTLYSDYQTMVGRKRARIAVIRIEGMPLNDARVTVDSMRINVPIDTAIFAPPVMASRDVRFLGGGTVARLPFDYHSRHLWVKASVNGGPPEDFLLDTGASTTVLDSGWAARRKIAMEGRVQAAGAGANGTASFATIDSIRVDGINGEGVVLVGQKVAVLSLNPFLEPFFWTPVAGVLGYDFISRFVMEIDYDAQRLTLHEPKDYKYAGKGVAVPLTLAGNIPVVDAKLDDRYEGKFRLDIGSGSTADIHGPFARLNDLAAQLTGSVEVIGGGFGGTFKNRLGRMKKMAIGPFSWADPIVSLSAATSGGFASEDYAGNFGNQMLERFRATFDYERRTIHLEPGARYGQRDRFSKAGLLIAKMPDGYRAMQVLKGSAAERAGVIEGDAVRSVDGRPIERWTQDELSRRFEDGAVGEKHVIEVVRAGKPRKLTMKLAEIL